MKLNLSQVRLIVFGLILILISGSAGYFIGVKQPLKIEGLNFPERNIDFSLFWTVWDELAKAYIDQSKLKPQNMFYGAISGMVASLGDPYTAFLPPQDNKQVKEDLNGSFEGVGIELGYDDRSLTVIAPLPGMPAQEAGVRAGDYILKIDDQDSVDINLPEAVKLIRGPAGTKIKLTLLHRGEKEPFEVTLVRRKIVVPSVEMDMKTIDGKKVAHLKLFKFGDRTSQEWQEAVEKIVSESEIEGVVLDLRGNPGGYLDGSVYIASEFISSGVVVQQESSSGRKESFSVDRRGQLTKTPLVVLVDQGSASASEIVAGCLQDYNRAIVVGETTFGKGTIQEAKDFPGGSGLHVTTARWLLPKGRSIDKTGIEPDIKAKDDLQTDKDEALEKALSVILES